MLRKPWLIPFALPAILLFLVLRIIRLPVNVLLWASNEWLEWLLMNQSDRSFTWPGWHYLWGGW